MSTTTLPRVRNQRPPQPWLTPSRLGIYAFLLLSAVFFLLPLYVMVVTSLKPMSEIRLGQIFALPSQPNLEAWAMA